MSDPATPLPRIRLLVDSRDGSPLPQGVDGAVVDANSPLPGPDVRCTWLLMSTPEDAPDWAERSDVRWVADGLAAAVACRERWPDLPWLPRISAQRAVVRYRMTGHYPGDGFRVFAPDTRALTGWEIDPDTSLSAGLREAWDQGFSAVWLHDASGEAEANGPDLNILERARNVFAGQLVLSTDLRSADHLTRLVDEPELVAVVMPAACVAGQDCNALIAALTPERDQVPQEDVA